MSGRRLPLWIATAGIALILGALPVRGRMLFAPADAVAVTSRPSFLVVDDLDRDGVDDVVLVSTRDTVSILYGSSSSATLFEAPLVVSIGKRLRGAAVGDTNQDGMLDVVVADERLRGAFLIESRSSRSFATPRFVPTGIKPYSVAVADIDHLGGADLVVGERRTGVVSILLNRSSQTFAHGPRLASGDGLAHIRCSDLDGDSLPELIAVSAGRFGQITIFPGLESRGAIAYSDSISFPTDANRAELVIGDVDDNGTMDLALLSGTRGRDTSRIEVAMIAADNGVAATDVVDTPCPRYGRNRRCHGRGLAAADFDGDGILDLAVGLRNQSSAGRYGTQRAGLVSFLRGRGDTFVPDGVAPWLERAPEAIAAGDFNGDGRPDIVAITRTRSRLQAMVNLSSPGPTVRSERRRVR